jgi:hypothetical protein
MFDSFFFASEHLVLRTESQITCESRTPSFANWGIGSTEALLSTTTVQIAAVARRTLKSA